MKRVKGKAAGLVAALLGLGLAVFIPSTSQARVQGQCADCHTMHNSQNGQPMTFDGNATPNSALTRGDCIGCHTGVNESGGNIPYVLSETAPTYRSPNGVDGNTLAGGNFYWVATSGGANDTKGHNVDFLADEDSLLGKTPPGWDQTLGVGPNEASWTKQLTCAGVYGCHGDRTATDNFSAVSGAHHADDSTIDGNTVGTSFRFLLGIVGKEDNDWEYTVSSTDHNQYKGVDRTDDTDANKDSSTISYLCSECHPNFHRGTSAGNVQGSTGWGSPWVRHPTDFDMNNVSGKEYGSYGGTSHTYQVEAPVASVDVSSIKSTVLQTADDAIVTCVSCHRAHGSPYADLLRWDYNNMVAGTSGTGAGEGCFRCHTTKDGI